MSPRGWFTTAVGCYVVVVGHAWLALPAENVPSFPPWGWGATVAYCLFMVGWMVRAYTARYRPPEEA